ncbi:MAG: hypothetical protein NVS4B3_04920 [Gemmatimonadaceae bacterium]
MSAGVLPSLAPPGVAPHGRTLHAGPRADAVLYALAGVVITTVWRAQDLFPALGFIRPVLTTLILATVLFTLDRMPRRSLSAVRSPVVGLVFGLFLVLAIGAPVGLWPGGSVMFLLRDVVPAIATMVLVAAAVRHISDVEFIAATSVGGAVLFSLVVLATVSMEGDGRLGHLFYYDVNDLALLLVAHLPLAVLMLRPGNPAPRRMLAVVAIPIFVVTVVRTGSRGGFLALLAVAVYLLMRYRGLPARSRALVFGVGLALLVGAGTDRYWSMMQTMLHPQADYNWAGNTYDGRMEIWKRGLGYFTSRPLLGVGVGGFPVAEGQLSDVARLRREMHLETKWSVAHNSYIQIAAEGGVVAVALFFAMGIAAFRTLRAVGRAALEPLSDARLGATAQALTGSLVGYVVAGSFISAQYFAFLYVLLGLTAGVEKLARYQLQRARDGA